MLQPDIFNKHSLLWRFASEGFNMCFKPIHSMNDKLNTIIHVSWRIHNSKLIHKSKQIFLHLLSPEIFVYQKTWTTCFHEWRNLDKIQINSNRNFKNKVAIPIYPGITWLFANIVQNCRTKSSTWGMCGLNNFNFCLTSCSLMGQMLKYAQLNVTDMKQVMSHTPVRCKHH